MSNSTDPMTLNGPQGDLLSDRWRFGVNCLHTPGAARTPDTS
jgi:hypothetical protein